MPIVRTKFESVSLESASNLLSGWSWKNTSNLLTRDSFDSNFEPNSVPYSTSGSGATYSTHYIVLSNLDFTFPNNYQDNYKLTLNWRYNLVGSGVSIKITSLNLIFPDNSVGKNKNTNNYYLTSANSGKDLILADGLWTTVEQSKSLTYSILNDNDFRIKIGFDLALNDYDSLVDSFGIDYFYLDVSWNHKYGSMTTKFQNADVIHRTNPSTDISNYPSILGSGAGWTWSNPSNAVTEDTSFSTYNSNTVYDFSRVSTSSNYGQYDWYVSDYIYLRNLQNKINSGYTLTGMKFRYKKRSYYEIIDSITNEYSAIEAFDDEIRAYNGSSLIGDNNIKPIGYRDKDLVPWPKETNDTTQSWWGWLPGGSFTENSSYYGSESDTWNIASFNPTTVNDNSFGILISPKFAVYWWENAAFPIPWGINYNEVTLYYSLYSITDYINVPPIETEENVSNLHTLYAESYIYPNAISSLENFSPEPKLNEQNIDPDPIDSNESFPAFTISLLSKKYINPPGIDSEEEVFKIYEQFIGPYSVTSNESVGITELVFPDFAQEGNMVSSFLNFEVLNFDSSFGSTYFTWINPEGAKYYMDNNFAYLGKDQN